MWRTRPGCLSQFRKMPRAHASLRASHGVTGTLCGWYFPAHHLPGVDPESTPKPPAGKPPSQNLFPETSHQFSSSKIEPHTKENLQTRFHKVFLPFLLGLHAGAKLRASERGHSTLFSLSCLPQLTNGGPWPVACCIMTPQRYQVLIPAICVISSRKSLCSYDQIYRCDWVFEMGR